MKMNKNIAMIQNVRRNLVAIDELLSALAQDEHYKIKDPKGNKLHNAFNALNNAAGLLKILEERLSK